MGEDQPTQSTFDAKKCLAQIQLLLDSLDAPCLSFLDSATKTKTASFCRALLEEPQLLTAEIANKIDEMHQTRFALSLGQAMVLRDPPNAERDAVSKVCRIVSEMEKLLLVVGEYAPLKAALDSWKDHLSKPESLTLGNTPEIVDEVLDIFCGLRFKEKQNQVVVLPKELFRTPGKMSAEQPAEAVCEEPKPLKKYLSVAKWKETVEALSEEDFVAIGNRVRLYRVSFPGEKDQTHSLVAELDLNIAVDHPKNFRTSLESSFWNAISFEAFRFRPIEQNPKLLQPLHRVELFPKNRLLKILEILCSVQPAACACLETMDLSNGPLLKIVDPSGMVKVAAWTPVNAFEFWADTELNTHRLVKENSLQFILNQATAPVELFMAPLGAKPQWVTRESYAKDYYPKLFQTDNWEKLFEVNREGNVTLYTSLVNDAVLCARFGNVSNDQFIETFVATQNLL